MKLNFKPDAIIVSMPARFFQEYTMEKFLQDLHNMNTVDGFVWYRVMKNLPKVQTPYCYWIIDGRIKYRMEIAKLVRNKTMRFARPKGGIRTFENANYIELVGPVIEAPYHIPMRGFQGFRYSELIF
jgi:hypothetical protein